MYGAWIAAAFVDVSVIWPEERAGRSVVMKVIGEGAEGPRGER